MEAKEHVPFILAATPLIPDLASLVAEFVGSLCVDAEEGGIECTHTFIPCARCHVPVCEAHCFTWKPEYTHLCSRCDPGCQNTCMSHKVMRGGIQRALYDGLRKCAHCGDVICRRRGPPICGYCHYRLLSSWP